MNDLQESLKDLRDIHLPEPTSFWPLAPGWWILIVLIPLLYFVIRYFVRQMLMPKYKKMALAELKNISSHYEVSKNKLETCGEVSLLIRQALVAKLGNQAVAGLVSEEWLAYLDGISKTDSFSNGAGRNIITAPYAKDADGENKNEFDIAELMTATKKLLGRL